jgi:hypothetical protein
MPRSIVQWCSNRRWEPDIPPEQGSDKRQFHCDHAFQLPAFWITIDRKMLSSLEEALAILNKWKDESTPVFVVGQNSSRWGLRSIHEGGVDWNIGLRGKVSQVSAPHGTMSPKAGMVVFEGLAGNLSLSMDGCAFSYDQPCEGPPLFRGEDQITAVSCLFIFFPSNEAFVVYELQER